MIGLWMFGSPLEQLWGKNKFIFFYISSGLGAAAFQLLYSSYDFNLIFEILVNNGFNSDEIINTIKTNRYNTNWLSYISENQLSQTLINLLINAADAKKPGPEPCLIEIASGMKGNGQVEVVANCSAESF